MSDSVEDIGRHGSKIAKIVKNIAKRSRFTSPGSESVEQESERGGGRVRLGDLFDHDEGGDVNPEQEQHWPHVLVEAEQGGPPGAPRGKEGNLQLFFNMHERADLSVPIFQRQC